MRKSRQVPLLTIWDEFVGSVDDAVFECNYAAHKAVWQIEIGYDCVRIQSLQDPTLALDIEFFPKLLRAVALFSPSGVMHIYDFGSGRELVSELGPNAVPASPRTLGRRLVELILDTGVQTDAE